MGCGASKGTEVVQPNRSLPAGKHQPINIINNYYTQDGTSYNPNGQPFQPPIQRGDNYNPTSNNNLNFNQNENLPPPIPPTEDRDQLLHGKEDMLKRADDYAKNASKEAAAKNTIAGFTANQLIPPQQTATVVKVSQNSPEQTPKTVLNDSTNTSPSQSTSGRSTPIKENFVVPMIGEDHADELLEQHKRVIEQEQRQKEIQKYRQDMTLKEKLAKRREIMKKRKEAELRGEKIPAAREEVVEKKKKIAAAEQAGEARVPPDEEGVAMPEAPVAAFVPTEIEAAEDKYEDVVSTVAPQPSMPEVDKELIYSNEENVEFFKDLEDFAVNLKTLTSPDVTFADLMEKLLINELSDLEKVRILFHWITVQDLNAINFPPNIDLETPLGYLFSIKCDKKTYAELFSRLCSAAGLHAKTIVGYLKGVGYTPDYVFQHPDVDKFRGSWNSVLVYGQWRLIDTHWGARHVLEDDEKTQETWETHYKYEEHYFLTNPDQLISSHFPDDKEWQLMKNPISIKQYQDLVKVWALYYKLKLQLHSHQKGVIDAPEDGVVEITIKSSKFSRSDATFKCGLTTKDRKKMVGNIELDKQVFHYSDEENEVFLVHIPAPGQYLFKVFGLSQKYSEENVYTNVCLYQINAKKVKPRSLKIKDPYKIKPKDLVAPFPVVPNQWGPTELDTKGVKPVSHKQAIVHCDEKGEATIVWQIPPGNEIRDFTTHIYEMNGHVLPNRCVQYKTFENGKNYVKFCLRTPQQGFHALKLFTKSSRSEEDTYSEFCNFILASFAQKSMGDEFPAVANGDIGVIYNEFEKVFSASKITTVDSRSFAATNVSGCWLTCPEGSVAAFTFSHSRGATVLATLEASSGENVNDYVSVFSTPTSSIVTVQPPVANVPEVLLNIFAAELGVSTGIPNVYKAFINTSKTGFKEMIIPSPPVQSWGPTSNFYQFEMEIVDWKYQSMFRSEAPYAGCIQDSEDDFLFSVKSKTPMSYMEKVFHLDGDQWEQQNENTSFLQSQESQISTFKVRFLKKGFYHTVLYGAPSSTSGKQLKPLMYNLIKVNTKSTCQDPFPKSYGLWTSNNVHLISPAGGVLKANVENHVQIRISQAEQNNAAFSKVLLLTAGSTPVYPESVEASSNTYTWKYLPGPGETSINMVVKPREEDDSLNYALQFSIVP